MDFTLHRIVMSSAAYGAYAYPYAAYAYTGCRNAAGAAVPCAYHNVAKRSADAEADASPYFYGGYYGGYPYAAAYGAYPYAYAAYAYNSPCKNGAGFPVPCAAHTVAKRSAEAEADPAYFVSPFLARYGFPATFYGHGLTHTSHFGVCTNYKGEQVAC